MTLYSVLLYVFISTAALSALSILLIKDVFKAALLLLACLLSVAALYVLMFAEFIAVTQILIYAGGVMVLIIFGVMLTSKISGKPLKVEHNNIFYGIIAGLGIISFMIYLFNTYIKIEEMGRPAGSISSIGMKLLTDFALPFEVSGLLLLVALIGAAVTTSILKSKKA